MLSPGPTTSTHVQGEQGDLAAESLGCLRNVLMAQAQECVMLKAIRDSKTPSLLARIAQQVWLHMYEKCRCRSHCSGGGVL